MAERLQVPIATGLRHALLVSLAQFDLCGQDGTFSADQQHTYDSLWQQYLSESHRSQASKRQLAVQLIASTESAKAQTESHHTSRSKVVARPTQKALHYDRASIDAAQFACTCLEVLKKASGRLVLVREHADGPWRAGRVQAFLSHAPPGASDTELQQQLSFTHVHLHWHGLVPPGQPAIYGLLGCLVFAKVLPAVLMAACAWRRTFKLAT